MGSVAHQITLDRHHFFEKKMCTEIPAKIPKIRILAKNSQISTGVVERSITFLSTGRFVTVDIDGR